MNIRAAIFDVYTTILEVGAPPSNGDALWQRLFAEKLGQTPPLTRTQFSARTAQVIARQHAEAKARGIPWPEILWPAVVLQVIPDLARLRPAELEDFLIRQMQMGRTLRLADGAAQCLRRLNEDHCVLGIASNSQAYTLRELDVALQGAGLNLSMFDRELRFWSFEHGFSKPDPHVFRILSARLEARGISAGETLMVGDRLDNDIEPAQAHGWRVWHLKVGSPQGGGFRELTAALG